MEKKTKNLQSLISKPSRRGRTFTVCPVDSHPLDRQLTSTTRDAIIAVQGRSNATRLFLNAGPARNEASPVVAMSPSLFG